MLANASRLIGLTTAGLLSSVAGKEKKRGVPFNTKNAIRKL